MLRDIVADGHVVSGRLPRFRERFEGYTRVVDEIALYNAGVRAIVVDGDRRVAVPDSPVSLDADVLKFVATDRVVVRATVNVDGDRVRVVDPVVLSDEVSLGAQVCRERLAIDGDEVAKLVAVNPDIACWSPDTEVCHRTAASPRACLLVVQELVVLELNIVGRAINTDALTQHEVLLERSEVLESEALNADVGLATHEQKRNAVAQGSQGCVVERDLIASARGAGVAAATARRNAEPVGLKGDVIASRARNTECEPLIVCASHDVDGRARGRAVHGLLNCPPRC